MWTKVSEIFRGSTRTASRLPISGKVLALLPLQSDLYAIEADVRQGTVQVVHRMTRLRLTSDDRTTEIKQWLTKLYADGAITAKQVLIVLPRSMSLTRQFDLPVLSADAADEAIRLQAIAWLPLPIETYLIDSIAAPLDVANEKRISASTQAHGHAESNSTSRRYHVVAVQRQAIQEILSAVAQAGGDVVGVTTTMSSAGMVAAGSSARIASADANSLSLVALPVGEEWELALVDGYLPLGGLTIAAGTTPTETLARLQQGANRLTAAMGVDVDRLTIISDVNDPHNWPARNTRVAPESDIRAIEYRTLASLTGESSEVDAKVSNVGNEASNHVVAPLLCGLIAAGEGTAGVIDLMRPYRQETDTISPRYRWGVVAAVVMGVTVGFLAIHQWRLSQMDAAIATLEQEIARMNQTSKAASGRRAVAAEIAHFEQQRIDWSQRLLHLATLLPEEEVLYLSSVQLRPEATSNLRRSASRSGHGAPSSDSPNIVAANLHLSGYAQDEQDLFSLQERVLEHRPHYQLIPHGFRPTQHDNDYGLLFELEVIDRREGVDQ